MQNFKDKLFNYEASPPANVWDNIADELDADAEKVIRIPELRKRSRLLFYVLTAAASLVIIFLSSLFFEKSGNKNDGLAFAPVNDNFDSSSKLRDKDSLNNITLEDIIKSSRNKTDLAKRRIGQQKKYITIAGPGGQPVRISSKVATLIVSADNDYPPKPVWDKKIKKWKELMLSSTLSPTATNLLDIAELSSMRGDN